MKLLFYFIFLLFSGVGSSFAQTNATIKGKVEDGSGEPAAYMTVMLEGSVLGTTTDEQGQFELSDVKPGTYILRLSGVGYTTLSKEIDVTSNTQVDLDFTVQNATGMLGEVIVSASRSVETLDETPSAVHIVSSRDINNQMKINTNIASILAAQVPGLALNSNTTSNTGQTLRGRNVLVMVDGIPQSTPLRAGGRDIRTIDPEVIDRIEVVKGATAIYGNGADGGLINYITKKPQGLKPFSAYTSITNTGMLVHSNQTFGGRLTQQFSGKINSWDYVASGTYERTRRV